MKRLFPYILFVALLPLVASVSIKAISIEIVSFSIDNDGTQINILGQNAYDQKALEALKKENERLEEENKCKKKDLAKQLLALRKKLNETQGK